MSSLGRVDTDQATFVAAETIGKNLRVKVNGDGELEVAGAESYIGFAVRDAAANEAVAVRLVAAPSFEAIASAAVTVGTEVTGSAAGKVAGGAGGLIAITAASQDGDTLVLVPQK